ncbi:MAG: CopG family transcriptional regulator [Rhodopirellula sp.]|nr:CopG family transcriptional regulator [Rhodopirellula sp.]
MRIELPNDVNDFVKGLVFSGRFESEEAAIAEGLRLLRSREQLRSEVAKGFKQLDGGQWVDGDEVFDEVHREIDAIEDDRSPAT